MSQIFGKIYASDEGFGHLVRQQAIVAEMQELDPGIEVVLQTKRHASAVKWIFNSVNLIEKFNNIAWARKNDGTPDLDKIRAFYLDYIPRSNEFIRTEDDLESLSFVLSDFVYEAFPLAVRANVPAFGVCHFPWDWFFSKLYPVPVATEVLDRLHTYALSADVLYFPPFTPKDVLATYAKNAKEVPLIVRRQNPELNILEGKDKFKILIMDSGANVLSSHIAEALQQIDSMKDFHFFVSEYFEVNSKNVTFLKKDQLFADYMPHMDLVITRGGFNTISECIAYRTPLLLVGEPMNPEMEINMLTIKQEELGSFVSIDNLRKRFREVVYRFRDNEYCSIKKSMQEHNYPHNGARVIAEDILNRVGGL